jgi:hypothetical protein
MTDAPRDPGESGRRELDELVRELKRLVEQRTRLERRGAQAEDVESQTAEIDRARSRLAAFVRTAGDRYSEAA